MDSKTKSDRIFKDDLTRSQKLIRAARLGTAASSNGEVTMQADWNEIAKAVARARAFYETVRPMLEATAMHKFVCVNANSGEYVIGDSIRETHQTFDKKFGVGVPSWITQVGNPNHVGSGLGLLQ